MTRSRPSGERGVRRREIELERHDDGLAAEERRRGLAHFVRRPHLDQATDVVTRPCVGFVPAAAAEVGGVDRGEVAADDRLRIALIDEPALFEQDRLLAQAPHGLHVVAHEEDGTTVLRHLSHAAETALLELRIAHGEHLVDDEDLGLQERGDRECEPHVHPARVALDGRVDEVPDAGEVDDVVELPGDLLPAHAENASVQEDVLPARQLAVEAGADLEQRPDTAADVDKTLGGLGDPREHLQQRGLPGAVATDDRDRLSLLHLERHVAERPDLRCGGPCASPAGAPS